MVDFWLRVVMMDNFALRIVMVNLCMRMMIPTVMVVMPMMMVMMVVSIGRCKRRIPSYCQSQLRQDE